MPHDKPNPKAKRGGLSWPLVVIALLGGHAALIITAVVLAVTGTGRGVVPDYYTHAIGFDAHKADLAASKELGWALTLLPGSLVDDQGHRLIAATLLDRDGEPIADATLEVRFIRLAYGQNITASFASVSGSHGRYAATVTMPAAGWYSSDALVTVGETRFVQVEEIQVPGTRATATEGGAP